MRFILPENGPGQGATKQIRSINTDNSIILGLCLHELLERTAEKYADKIAIICGDAEITFQELKSSMNSLARVLVQQGIRHNDIVGVALDRSIDLVVTLLAVLKTGAAYVPIDPALPMERISQMLNDACPKLLITGDQTLDEFIRQTSLPCLNMDKARQAMNATTADSSNLGVPVRTKDLAYVMYTSGSTGRPKGVEITHGSISNLMYSLLQEPGCVETDRLLAITTVSFDMAVVELFLPLVCGATTVIAQKHEIKDMSALLRLMVRHNITIMQGTPAIWQMLLDSGWRGEPRLSKIFCGGEALSRALANRLLACGDMMWNMYGPTEATVYASIWRVQSEQDVIIGNSIINGHLYILDENLSPVPHGQLGELCIGGAGVARGYRNNSEMSRSKFVTNPFHDGFMYRTGDVARFVAPGEVSVLGRADGQVKIRGHRIEPGDIEAAITTREDISGAVVVCRDDRLVAYFVRKAKSGELKGLEPWATKSLDRALRLWVAERLPAYMVPAFFIELEAFPVTMNGKIDRKALPDPSVALQTNTAPILPASDLEARLLAIWSQVLGHNQIGIHDNFFEVGGDSARLVRVQKKLEESLGRQVPSPKLFEHYTIKTLAWYLSNSHEANQKIPSSPHNNRIENSTADIAIVSLACRLPGGVTTPEGFWHLLERGDDTISDVPVDRWNPSLLDGSDTESPGQKFCRKGGFISSIESFDISFFGISPREAARLDPSQYVMLETCWEGFERAGYTATQLRDSSTGVFIGTSNILSHQGLSAHAVRDLESLDGYTVTGSAAGTMSGRISYQLGLQGPSMTIDTACSSSLVSTHLACNALRLGECDMAISGGVSLMLNPGLHAEFSRLQGMSPDGICRSFSADSQGTGWSEGCVAVVLKRLTDAQRDGDTIQAVIRGSAVQHDGRTATLTTPSGDAQQRLIRKALATAGLQPDDLDYIEAHGTGTRLGDPIEATALAEVFGPSRAQKHPLFIGSAKSNIGHTQAAAGLVGLLKVVLSLRNGLLPQTLHITKPTPAVQWDNANMTPVLRSRPWQSQNNRLRRAGISAFGIGGTNAHVIIEEPSDPQTGSVGVETPFPRPLVLPFLLSGDTDASLRGQAAALHKHIESDTSQQHLHNIAYSLAVTRTHFRKRTVIMATEKSSLLKQLEAVANHKSPILTTDGIVSGTSKLAMLFSGQGSQWPGMGKNLCGIFPSFDKSMREIAEEFSQELEIPLLEVMWAEPGSTKSVLLNRTDFAQPALFTLEVALWRLWKALGVTPDFVLGHSLGELVVAHVAGILSLPDACRLVAARGRLMEAQSGNYSMAAVEATATEMKQIIDQHNYGDRVDIALFNTPTQTVISGSTDAVECIAAEHRKHGRMAKIVVTGHAFHSCHMDGMLADFQAVVDTVRFHPPQASIISSLDGGLVNNDRLNTPQYWLEQVRRPVRFSDAIQTLASHGVNVFIELGPEPVLCGMGAETLSNQAESQSNIWLSSLSRRTEGTLLFHQSVGQLYVQNMAINWKTYFEPLTCHRVQLPTYVFQRNYVLKNDVKAQPSHVAKALINGSQIGNYTETLLQGNQPQSQFEIIWRPVHVSDAENHGTWGLVVSADDSAWAANVRSTLSGAGMQILQIEHLEHAGKLEGLIYLWDSDADVVIQTQELLPKALSQLQVAAQAQFTTPLVWITRGAVGTGMQMDDQSMRLGAGPLLWGLMRTARNEHPELNLRLVDLDVQTTIIAILSALRLNTEPECAVREGRVLVPRMQHVKQLTPISAQHSLVRKDGAVLITGGLGYFGAHVARWLVAKHGVRDLVLTSRHGMNAHGAEQLISELSNFGARVDVLTSDIAELDNVTTIIAMFSADRPLRGIVHAAGVVDSGVLLGMTQERCEKTIAPKAHGALFLHQSTRNMDLDFFIMVSSISGVMGMPGLANYAAANTFLDALAHMRRAQGLPGTSIAFGTLAGDGGMASRLGANTRSHLSQFGLDPLTLNEGLKLLEGSVLNKRALSVAANLDLKRLQGFLEQQDGVMPPLLANLLTSSSGAARSPISARRSLQQGLIEADPKLRVGMMLEKVQQVVAQVLGFSNPLEVEVDRDLKDLGIDSLTAVQIRNHLAALTSLKLSVNIALAHPNLRVLSKSLLSQLLRTDPSHTTKNSTSRLDMVAIQKGCLDSSFKFNSIPSEGSRGTVAGCQESVLLTGATGFVGVYILFELLKQGIKTYCLIRAESDERAHQRLVSTMQEYSLWDPNFAPLLKPVVGDLSQPLLGMSEQAFDDIARQVDSICHSGALVDWMRPLEDYVGPNIVSAHEVLRLASRGRPKAVHLISTISTLPKHLGLDLTENDLEYGYGTSKYLAEKMLSSARWRGATGFVYRLPYVTASTATGHFRQDRGDFLHNFITGCLEMGAFPDLDTDLSAVLPVDYLARTVVDVMMHHTRGRGRDFDFLNTHAPSCAEFFSTLNTINGGNAKEVLAYGIWKQRVLAYAAVHPQSPLARITAVVDSYTDETANTIFKGLPVGEYVLGADHYPAPPIDEQFLQRYLGCVKSEGRLGEVLDDVKTET
ncbi:Reducing polyketide synthase swnK [Paramyrothecium foliicola]|nr:Reducing polyketide synthase swnK [Paramyrothecium foliicola]